MLTDFADRLQDQLGPGVELRTVAMPRFAAFAFDIYLKLQGNEWLHLKGSAPDDIVAQPWHVLINLSVMLLAIETSKWIYAGMIIDF